MFGELIVNILPFSIQLEMYRVKGKRREFQYSQVVDHAVPLSDLGDSNVLELANVIRDFINRGRFKRGRVHIIISDSENDILFENLDYEIDNVKAIKKMLPMDVADLGETYNEYNYKYIIKDSRAFVLFADKTMVARLSNLNVGNSWDIHSILPIHAVYGNLVEKDGVVLELGDSEFRLFYFKDGLLNFIEKDILPVDFSGGIKSGESFDEVVRSIGDIVIDYVSNFNLSNQSDIDTVYVTHTDKVSLEGLVFQYDDFYFQNIEDKKGIFLSRGGEFKSEEDDGIGELDYSTIAMGIVRGGIHSSELNFAPKVLESLYRNILTTSVSFSVASLVLLIVMSLYFDSKLTDLNNEVASYERELSSLIVQREGIEADIDNNVSLIDDYNEYVSSLRTLGTEDDNFISSVLDYLPDHTPSRVHFSDIILKKGTKTLLLEGHSENYRDIGSLAIELEQFGEVVIHEIWGNSVDNDNGYPFQLELRSR